MNITMFIIGSIIFVAYMFGLLYAVNWGHTTQRDEMERDRELQQFFNKHDMIDYDGMGNQGRMPAPKKKKQSISREIEKAIKSFKNIKIK